MNIEPDFTKDTDITNYFQIHNLKIKQLELDTKCFTFADDKVINLKKKIEEIGVPLKNWDVKIYRGILTGFNEAFIIDNATKERLCKEDPKSAEILKPILRGRDIYRYGYKWAGLWMIKIESGWTNKNRYKIKAEEFFKNQYPAIYKHLISFKDVKGKGKGLLDRDDQGDYWWELRDCDYYPEFEKEKIVWAETAQKIKMAYVPRGFYLQKTCFMITGNNLKYIQAITNLFLLDWYIKQSVHKLGEKGVYLSGYFMEQLPIPKISNTEQKPFIDLVDQILAITKDDDYLENPTKQAKVREYEKQIDQLVYKLYVLTEEEIKIVEGERK